MKDLISNGKQILWYLRLSLADDGKDESNSISSQRKCIADYCRKYFHYENHIECVDDGYSGTNFERPGFQKMMLLVRNGAVKTVILKDLSRFGRNYLKVGYYLEYVFPCYGVRIIAINDQFDSAEFSNGTAGMEVAIRNFMNECYSRDISRKISSAVHVKKMDGEYVFGAVPFGYKKGQEKNSIVIDEEAAKIVRYVFSLALSGLSYSAIAKRLNEEKVITPSKYLAEYGGRQNYRVVLYWSYESVRNLLGNRIYTGDTETYKSHVKKIGSNQVKYIPASERVVIENTHEAIVSRDDFEKAGKVVKVTKPKSPSAGCTSILNGYLECGYCGGKLTKGKSQNHYFLCVNARYRPEAGCGQVRAEEKNMKRILFNAIRTQVAILKEEDIKLKKMLDKSKSRILELQKELSRLSVEEKRGMEQNMKLYEDFVQGNMDKETYMREKNRVTEKMNEVKLQKAVLTDHISDLSKEQAEHSRESSGKEVFQAYNEKELTRDMLAALIDKVVIRSGNEIEIFWKYKNELSD